MGDICVEYHRPDICWISRGEGSGGGGEWADLIQVLVTSVLQFSLHSASVAAVLCNEPVVGCLLGMATNTLESWHRLGTIATFRYLDI